MVYLCFCKEEKNSRRFSYMGSLLFLILVRAPSVASPTARTGSSALLPRQIIFIIFGLENKKSKDQMQMPSSPLGLSASRMLRLYCCTDSASFFHFHGFCSRLKENTCCTPFVSVKELPFRTPPLTFALSGCAPIGGEAEMPLKIRRNKIWNLNYHSRTGTLNA